MSNVHMEQWDMVCIIFLINVGLKQLLHQEPGTVLDKA